MAPPKWRSGGTVTLIPSNSSACVCQPTSRFYLTYMDSSREEFRPYDCLDEPRSDMLRRGDGTGRELPNQGLAASSFLQNKFKEEECTVIN